MNLNHKVSKSVTYLMQNQMKTERADWTPQGQGPSSFWLTETKARSEVTSAPGMLWMSGTQKLSLSEL